MKKPIMGILVFLACGSALLAFGSSKGLPKPTPGEVRDIHIAGNSPDALPGSQPREILPASRKPSGKTAARAPLSPSAKPTEP